MVENARMEIGGTPGVKKFKVCFQKPVRLSENKLFYYVSFGLAKEERPTWQTCFLFSLKIVFKRIWL